MWKTANRLLVWMGPGLPAAYFAVLTLLAQAAPTNPTARSELDIHIENWRWALSTWWAWAAGLLVLLLWGGGILFTEHMATNARKAMEVKKLLAEKARILSEQTMQLLAAHQMQDALNDPHDRNRWQVSSTALMTSYTTLISPKAIAVVRAAERLGYESREYAVHVAGNPTNPLGVREIGQTLGEIAEFLNE